MSALHSPENATAGETNIDHRSIAGNRRGSRPPLCRCRRQGSSRRSDPRGPPVARDELGGTAHPADLSDPTDVATLIQRVEEEAGPIDVLVNNAGIDAVGGFCEAPPDELRRVTEVNYRSEER